MAKGNSIVYSTFAILLTVMIWTGFLLINYAWLKLILRVINA